MYSSKTILSFEKSFKYESLKNDKEQQKELKKEKQEVRFKICHLDREGVFLYRPESIVLSQMKKLELELTYKTAKTRIYADVIRIFGKNQGFGLRFYYPSRDAVKEMGDFVELIKGEGHA